MEFIRKCVGDKLVLACGVPLHIQLFKVLGFGLVDFCRIGADVALEWKYDYNRIREDTSIPNAVNCTVFSRHLNGRAFLNDPDVFILRDENINLTINQKKLLAEINRIFGRLLCLFYYKLRQE